MRFLPGSPNLSSLQNISVKLPDRLLPKWTMRSDPGGRTIALHLRDLIAEAPPAAGNEARNSSAPAAGAPQ